MDPENPTRPTHQGAKTSLKLWLNFSVKLTAPGPGSDVRCAAWLASFVEHAVEFFLSFPAFDLGISSMTDCWVSAYSGANKGSAGCAAKCSCQLDIQGNIHTMCCQGQDQATYTPAQRSSHSLTDQLRSEG